MQKILVVLIILIICFGAMDIVKCEDVQFVRFHLVADKPGPDNLKRTIKDSDEILFLEKEVCLDINDIASAEYAVRKYSEESKQLMEQYGVGKGAGEELLITFNKEGRDKLFQISSDNIMRRLALIIDEKLMMAPVIREPISDGKMMLTGEFKEGELKLIADKINGITATKRVEKWPDKSDTYDPEFVGFYLAYKESTPNCIMMTNTYDMETYFLEKEPQLTIDDIKSAEFVKSTWKTVGQDERAGIEDRPGILELTFTEEGKNKLSKITAENINKNLGVVINKQLIMAPVIRETIDKGKAQITGNMTEMETELLADRINEMISARKDNVR